MNCTDGNSTCDGSAGNSTFGEPPLASKAWTQDGFLAIVILIASVVLAGGTLYYMWNDRKSTTSLASTSVTAEFQEPKERAIYYQHYNELDESKELTSDQSKLLKKLLMNRAMATIPLIHKVQNEYQSTERLYKRGMVTEEAYNFLKMLKEYVNDEYGRVMEEAESMQEDWGKAIWMQANKFRGMLDMRERELENKKWADEDGDDVSPLKTNDGSNKSASNGTGGSNRSASSTSNQRGESANQDENWETDDDEDVDDIIIASPSTSAAATKKKGGNDTPSSSSSSSSSSSKAQAQAITSSSNGSSSSMNSPGSTNAGSEPSEAERKRIEKELLEEEDREKKKAAKKAKAGKK